MFSIHSADKNYESFRIGVWMRCTSRFHCHRILYIFIEMHVTTIRKIFWKFQRQLKFICGRVGLFSCYCWFQKLSRSVCDNVYCIYFLTFEQWGKRWNLALLLCLTTDYSLHTPLSVIVSWECNIVFLKIFLVMQWHNASKRKECVSVEIIVGKCASWIGWTPAARDGSYFIVQFPTSDFCLRMHSARRMYS